MLENILRKPSLSFKARSPERDNELIEKLVNQVASTLRQAAQEVEAQRDGLNRRLEAVTTRAAVIGGNDIDDSFARDEADAAALAASDVEIARAESRLKTLKEQLSHFTFLEATLHARFPMAKG
jgi:FixJ family two-component response regulator